MNTGPQTDRGSEPAAVPVAGVDPQADIAWIRGATIPELRALLAATMNAGDPVVLQSNANGDAARIRAYLETLPPVSIRLLLANAYMLVRSAFSNAALREACTGVLLRPDGDARAFLLTTLIPTVDAFVAALDRQR